MMARSSRLCGCFSVALVSRVVAGVIGVHVSDLAVWLSGRGPLGDWANSMLPAWAIAALLALGWSRSDCSRARHASNTC